MQPWFIWNNRNSYAEGLWVSKLPPIIRAPERYDEIQVPGRAGSLIMLEDDEDAIYDRYEKEVTVTAPNTLALQRILDWLSGSGEVIFSNEPDKAYQARIVSEVKFNRIDNTMVQAKVRFYVEPFKHERYPAKSKTTLTANGTIYNPGSVSSRPKVKILADTSVNYHTLSGQIQTSYFQLGNVALLSRPSVSAATMQAAGWGDTGGVATVYSCAYSAGSDGEAWNSDIIIHITPIKANGSVLTPSQLDSYVSTLLQQTTIETIISADSASNKLVLWVQPVNETWNEAYQRSDLYDDLLHRLQAVYYLDAIDEMPSLSELQEFDPSINVAEYGTAFVTIAGNTMSFDRVYEDIIIDCDAQIIFKAGENDTVADIWTGVSYGEYWKIPVGVSAVEKSANTIVIDPRWRWK